MPTIAKTREATRSMFAVVYALEIHPWSRILTTQNQESRAATRDFTHPPRA